MLPFGHVKWQRPGPKWQHQTLIWQHRWQHRVDRTGNICLDATDVSNWKADRSDAVFMQFLHIMVQERDQSQGLTLPANFPRVARVATCSCKGCNTLNI